MIKVEAVLNYMGAEGTVKKGDRFSVDEKRARFLIEHGLARVHNPPGPTETKPQEPAETKKFSGAQSTGLSTDTQSSSAPGQAAQQSSLQEDPASTPRRSRARKLLEKGKDLLSGSSQ